MYNRYASYYCFFVGISIIIIHMHIQYIYTVIIATIIKRCINIIFCHSSINILLKVRFLFLVKHSKKKHKKSSRYIK